jgi:hypothetical protein
MELPPDLAEPSFFYSSDVIDASQNRTLLINSPIHSSDSNEDFEDDRLLDIETI